jgi:cyclophilin family peptidyl-prolyl cis-trans isomerase
VAAARAQQQRRQRLRTVRNIAIAAVVIVGVIFFLSTRGGDDKSTVTASGSSASGSSTTGTTVPPAPFAFGTGACPAVDGSSPRTIDFTAAPQKCIDDGKTYTATFDTTAGKIVVKLDTTTTPGTANNFIVLARYHYYDGTTFFRASTSIGILQGGAPHDNSVADKGPGYTLQDEGFDYESLAATGGRAHGGPYSYGPGDLVMARKPIPNGASAQFFFAVTAQASGLDSEGVYVKFGTTTEGTDALLSILNSSPGADQPPNPPVTINTVTITET